MLLPDSFRDQVRAASDIVEVIGGYLPLKKAGGVFVGLCPFHKEKTPSFNVNPHKQFFYCFGCHQGGDVFKFVQQIENISFLEALKRLAERARIPLQMEANPGQEKTRFVKDSLLTIHEQITQRWQAALASEAEGEVARQYLAQRGVSPEAVKLFRLGYAPERWDDTINWARSRGHEISLLEQAGLVIRKEQSDQYYDRFRGRLMFPICDEQGRVIGFSGRILDKEKSPAKYVNSPETLLFTKGRVIYGLDKSKREILDKESVVICEGQLDLIACFMAGVRNIVAPQGTAFTSDQARVLRRYADEAVLCFDSDNAGQNATMRSLDILLAAGMSIRVAVVPAPHDPDSFIKQFGPEAFQKLVAEAGGFFEFFLDYLCRQNDPGTDKGRAAIVRLMGENLAKTGNAVLIDTYAQKTALRLGVSPDSVRTEFRRSATGGSRPAEEGYPSAEDETGEASIPRPPEQELWLLKLLLMGEDHVDWMIERLKLEWLTHEVITDLVRRRLQHHRDNTWPGFAAWLGEFQNKSIQSFLGEAVMQTRPLKDPEQILKGTPTKPGILQLLRDRYLEAELARINQQLSRPGITEEEQHALLHQKHALRQEKLTPVQ